MTRRETYELKDGRKIEVPYNSCYVAPVRKEMIEAVIDEINTSYDQAKILEKIKESYAIVKVDDFTRLQNFAQWLFENNYLKEGALHVRLVEMFQENN